MTPETRKRPRASGALYKKQVDETASPITVDDTADQMRRPREASLRLPPLSVASARAAYFHLEACGLQSDLVVDVLRREVA